MRYLAKLERPNDASSTIEPTWRYYAVDFHLDFRRPLQAIYCFATPPPLWKPYFEKVHTPRETGGKRRKGRNGATRWFETLQKLLREIAWIFRCKWNTVAIKINLLQNIQKVFSQNDGRLAGTVMTQPVLGLTVHTTPFWKSALKPNRNGGVDREHSRIRDTVWSLISVLISRQNMSICTAD